MTNRERTLGILRYQPVDRLPAVHFGYWDETLVKWASEGHITSEQAHAWADNNEVDAAIAQKLGFDFNWACCFGPRAGLFPAFERKVLETLPDGSRKVRNADGAVEIEKDGAGSIPTQIEHLLEDRASWEKHYLPRLQFTAERVDIASLQALPKPGERQNPLGLFCGSLLGKMRNWLGLEGLSYLYADDEDLYKEIIDTVGDLSYRVVERALMSGVSFDFAHFWEDICFKNGPLVNPAVFRELVGPHYKRITDLMKTHGIDIVSLDCDGCIDRLLPVWLDNGVNTMFPIEVGTWNASIAPWREQYGKRLLGVGGMDKRVFAEDRAAVDREIERLKPLIALGGYIPCPDHRIAPDAQWGNVAYYCEQLHKLKP